MGCEARKLPADAGVFFLDFFLYRTNQELTQSSLPSTMRERYSVALVSEELLYGRIRPSVVGRRQGAQW